MQPKPEPTKRIRGHALQKIRKRILRRDPLCVRCLAKQPQVVREAQEVDHVVPIEKGGKEEDKNRQGLCVECHQIKTAEDMGWQRKYGHDANGLPKDPNHHWNKK